MTNSLEYHVHKPYFCGGSEAMLALEGMVDRVGVAHVLYALEYICSAKAQHVSDNWQDQRTARAWERQSRRMQTAARKELAANSIVRART